MVEHFRTPFTWNIPCLYKVTSLDYHEIHKISGLEYIIVACVIHNNNGERKWEYYLDKLQLATGMQTVLTKFLEKLVDNNVLAFNSYMNGVDLEDYMDNFAKAPVKMLSVTPSGYEQYTKKITVKETPVTKHIKSVYNFLLESTEDITENAKKTAQLQLVERDNPLYEKISSHHKDETESHTAWIKEIAPIKFKLTHDEIIKNINVKHNELLYMPMPLQLIFGNNEEQNSIAIINPITNEEISIPYAFWLSLFTQEVSNHFKELLQDTLEADDVSKLYDTLFSQSANYYDASESIHIGECIERPLNNTFTYVTTNVNMMKLFNASKKTKVMKSTEPWWEKLITLASKQPMVMLALNAKEAYVYTTSKQSYFYQGLESADTPIYVPYINRHKVTDEEYNAICDYILTYCADNLGKIKANTIYQYLGLIQNTNTADSSLARFIDRLIQNADIEEGSFKGYKQLEEIFSRLQPIISLNNDWKSQFNTYKQKLNSKFMSSLSKKITSCTHIETTLKELVRIKESMAIGDEQFLGAIAKVNEEYSDLEPMDKVSHIDKIVLLLEENKFKDNTINKSFNLIATYLDSLLNYDKQVNLVSSLGILVAQYLNNLNALKKMAGITDIQTLTIKDDIDAVKFTETYKAFHAVSKRVNDYITKGFKSKAIYTAYNNVFEIINSVLVTEAKAYSKFKEINKSYIQKKINKNELRIATMELHIKLEVYLRKVLNKSKLRSVELLEEAKERNILSAKEYDELTELRKARNSLLHSKIDMDDLDISKNDLIRCSDIIFNKIEPLYKKEGK